MQETCLKRTEAELAQIEKQILALEKSLAHAPDGSLNVKPARGYPQYFQYLKDGAPKRRYLGRKDEKLRKSLAQKDYEITLLKVLKGKASVLKYCQEHYPKQSIDDVYEALSPARKALVTPVRPVDAQFVKQWQEAPYTGREFSGDDRGRYFTEKGERVRSKSEMIIAEALDRAGLPYKYECPLRIKDRILYPDFTILDMRTRQERYLEHFGMMDKPEYLDTFFKKLHFYEANGYLPGEKLIMTFESSAMPLDVRLMRSIIAGYFK